VEKKLPDEIEGGDMTPLFSAGTGTVERPRKELVFHFPHYQGDTPHSAILLGDYKLMKWYEDDRVRLFNLASDISESNDLSRQLPEKTAELKDLLETYLAEIDAQIPKPNPDYDPTTPSISKKGNKGNDKERDKKRVKK
jgi:hypothetical protein